MVSQSLVNKAWLETRWRFITGLLLLTLLAGSNVFSFIANQRLLPQLIGNSRNVSAGIDPMFGVAAAIREAIEVQANFRGFTWYRTFRDNLTQLGVFFAILLGCGGLVSESSKGSALFTLALPVTRRQLLGARTALGLAQVFALAMVPPLVIPLLAPAIGQQFGLIDALAHGVCLFVGGATFFGLASYLSTLYGDVWRPLLIGMGIACVVAIASFAVPQINIFSVMNGESYFRNGSLPWTGLLTSAVLASALLYSASESLERRDF